MDQQIVTELDVEGKVTVTSSYADVRQKELDKEDAPTNSPYCSFLFEHPLCQHLRLPLRTTVSLSVTFV